MPFALHRFDAGIRSANEVAASLGLDPGAVYKTLVLQGDTPADVVVLMAPADRDVNLKHVAAALGRKRLQMMRQRDAERVTGMPAGAISAILLRDRRYTILIAEEALERDTVLVSAGQHGADVELSVHDLLQVTGARAVPV